MEEWRKLHNVKLHDLCSGKSILWTLKVQEGEMGGATDMYTDRKERSFEGFGGEN
jgi:hypothetical protein